MAARQHVQPVSDAGARLPATHDGVALLTLAEHSHSIIMSVQLHTEDSLFATALSEGEGG